jgi:hypothetical protein
MTDQPRFIGRAAGYTTSPTHAIDPLEAPSEEQQRELTEAAHRRALETRIRTRQASASEIAREIEHVDARARYLRRQLARLSRA